IGLLQFLASELGPVQIEGAFPTNKSSTPYLYQLLKVPMLERDSQPLSIQDPDFRSQHVIGRGDFSCPMICVHNPWLSRARIADLDRAFGERGYILLTGSHSLGVMDASPHCRVRLSQITENLSSHAVTLTRLRINQTPSEGIILAM